MPLHASKRPNRRFILPFTTPAKNSRKIRAVKTFFIVPPLSQLIIVEYTAEGRKSQSEEIIVDITILAYNGYEEIT